MGEEGRGGMLGWDGRKVEGRRGCFSTGGRGGGLVREWESEAKGERDGPNWLSVSSHYHQTQSHLRTHSSTHHKHSHSLSCHCP